MMPHDHHHYEDRHDAINYQIMGVNDVLLAESMMSDLSINGSDNVGSGGAGAGVIAISNGSDIDAHLMPEGSLVLINFFSFFSLNSAFSSLCRCTPSHTESG